MKNLAKVVILLEALFLTTSMGYSQSNTFDKNKSLALKATTQYANINNHKIAYRKFGKGAPVFLANRFRGTLDTWDPLFIDLLAKENTVILFDYSGIGYSEGQLPLTMKDLATELVNLADYLKIDKFNVLGWSYGGWLAQYTTFYYPLRVLKTVVIDANAMGKNEIAMEPAFTQSGMKPNKDLKLDDYIILFFEPKSDKSRLAAKNSMERISLRMVDSKVPEKQEVLQRYFAPGASVNEDKENFRGAYATLKTPVLVLSGDHDISFAVDNWYPMIRKAPTMQLIVMPDAGHGPQHQYPELTSGYINNFLRN